MMSEGGRRQRRVRVIALLAGCGVGVACAGQGASRDSTPLVMGGASGSAGAGEAGSAGRSGGGVGGGGVSGAAGGSPAGGAGSAATSGGKSNTEIVTCAKGLTKCHNECIAAGTCATRERLFAEPVPSDLEKDLPEKRNTGPEARSAHSTALLDFDGDGVLDFVYGTQGEGSPLPEDDIPSKRFHLSVLRGRADCTFDSVAPIRLAEASNMGRGFFGTWIVDVDGDGHGDIISVARLLAGASASEVQTSLVVLFTHGDGTFARADVDLAKTDDRISRVSAIGHLSSPAAGGVDVVVNGVKPYVVRLDAKGAQTGVLPMPLEDAKGAVFLDLDGDGRDELLADGGLTPAGFGGFRREAEGWISVPVPMWADVPAGDRLPFSANSVLLGDIDGNGRVDYVDEARIALAGVGPSFLLRSRAEQGLTASFDLLADLDGDGNADLERNSTMLGDGLGAFAAGGLPVTLSGAVLDGYAYGDVDGDGILDAVRHIPRKILCAKGIGGVVLK